MLALSRTVCRNVFRHAAVLAVIAPVAFLAACAQQPPPAPVQVAPPPPPPPVSVPPARG